MKLRAFLSTKQMSVADFATKAKVSVAAVHRYLNDERRPRDEVMGRIIQITDGEVQPNDFFVMKQEEVA